MKSIKISALLITLTLATNFRAEARYIIDQDQAAYKFDQEYELYKEKIKNDHYAKNYEQNLQIHSLKRELASVANTYMARSEYLEKELTKTKEKLIETTVAARKKEEYYTQKYNDDLENLKQEIVLKNKILAEYQREIEKIKSNNEYKELAKQNLELASQLRNYNQKTIEAPINENNRRMPASVNP